MNQRPQNDHLRVNKTGKYIRKSIFHQIHANANAIFQPQQPQQKTQVYIINKNDFKSVVQQLTSYHSCEPLPQSFPKHQKNRPEPVNRTSSVPPITTVVQEDPHVSLYMRYLQSLLEDSSESDGDQFQQPFDESQSDMLAQTQVPKKSMSYSNGLEPVMTTTLTSPWFDGSLQQIDGAYSLESTRAEYPQPLTPSFTYSSMTQPGVFDPDLEYF
ncbi:hypothetical protein EUTSA_v10009422mg [Eutrema salsugineum]|uniref:VQ domain-containing protein n=1 Tax=Eutrema salsugineum TaxID=72664 RepID=V4K7G9_EUTSA|nr:VQ motif-containing protein 5 [Eutrema salsugineum]ESQ33525.1 hypothetical protein EUTSA_v10009422mg [Eutrema salsugineum]